MLARNVIGPVDVTTPLFDMLQAGWALGLGPLRITRCLCAYRCHGVEQNAPEL